MDILRKLRTEHNLSQQELADILHVSQQSIYKYEKGITAPDIETLKRMADYFKTSVDYIIEYSPFPQKIESAAENLLNCDEAAFVSKYRKLNARQQEILNTVLDGYFELTKE